MFDHPTTAHAVPREVPHFFDPVRVFLTENLAALERAAEMLAGRRGVRLVARIEAALSDHSGTTPIADHVGEVLDILELEHVHVDGSVEAARFAEIDPASREVEEICLLTDGLHRALDAAASDLRREARAWRDPGSPLAA